MSIRINRILGISFLFLFLFSLLSFPAFATKPSQRVVVGANLREYRFPTKTSCDINVPSQYSTIQTAVDAATPGDTVCVGAGTYNENVFINKSIRLSGKGAFKSIINGQTQLQNGTVLISANDVIVEGFLIYGLDSPPTDVMFAMHLFENTSGAIVRYNQIVSGNGGIALLTENAQTNNLIENNILVGNNSPYVADVSQFDNNKPSDKVDFLNNTFIGTVSPSSRSDTGITLNAGAPNSLIRQNIFNTSGTMIVLVASTNGNEINENNFNSNTPIKVGGTAPINAENNWWGDLDPSDNVQGGVDYTPFATTPFAEN